MVSKDPRLARPSWRGRTNVDALTIACIEHAERLAGRHTFTVTQGSYQAGAGDPNSAGTHDRGGVVDLRWCGHDACIRALREAGMAAWHRTPSQGPWPDHIHAVVIGHPYLAASAARQVTAYLDGRNGLASNGRDDGPRLDPIPRPVWPPEKEDDMNPAQEKKLDDALTWAKSARAQALAAHKAAIEVREMVRQIAVVSGTDLDEAAIAKNVADELARRMKE